MLSLVIGLSGCATPRTFTPEDRTAVEAVLVDQAAAWNRGDLDAYMAGYARTPDLVFTSGGAVRRGWDETITRYRAKYGTDRSTMGHLDFEILDVHPLGADGAIVLGHWGLTDTPNAAHGVFSVALERRPEGWKVVHDHTSVE